MVEAIKTTIEEPQDKTEKETYRGLCSTCKNAEHCTFPRNPDKPILQCDEFVGFEYEKSGEKPAGAKKTSNTEEVNSDSRFKGLCKICAKRETCTFPKPETGVWQCEEYE